VHSSIFVTIEAFAGQSSPHCPAKSSKGEKQDKQVNSAEQVLQTLEQGLHISTFPN
jgi:hypothetical protein